MGRLQASSFHISPRGKRNEDAILPLIHDGNYSLAAVADGLGGRENGHVASLKAIQLTEAQFLNGEHDAKNIMNKCHENFEALLEPSKMATTLTFALFNSSTATVGHVGDSRAYHLRGDGLLQVTQDQTEAQQLIDEGVLSKRRALSYHRKNVLLSAMGQNVPYHPFFRTFTIEAGDRIVLLTDGIAEIILRKEMRDISAASETAEDFCRTVEDELKRRTIRDDCSLAAVDVN